VNLYPFQLDAVERVAEAARQGKRVIVLQSPTGSGKTTIGCEIIRRAVAKGKRVLEIVHRRRLVDQFSDRLTEFGIDHGILMRGYPRRSAPVQVASRDTLLSKREDVGFELPPAELVIVDEGRHAASPEFRKLLEPYEKAGAYLVLLDATPALADGRGLGPWAKALVSAAPVTELVRQGYLCPAKCYAPDRQRRRGKLVRGICGDLVASWQRYAEGLPTVLFCSRVQHSRDAVEAFCAADIPAAHVDADTIDFDRDRVFDQLAEGKLAVVSNVGIIKEGVDLPCLGCCQFWMDPMGRVGFLQGVGRIMRPFPGKTHGVLIDHAGAVFRHGFPDEDTEWTLEGNADEAFARKHDEGATEKALYCKTCELVYHGQAQCPQCGRVPAKPPRSIFAPPPVEHTHELLTEAERSGLGDVAPREEKVVHWFRCLMVAVKKNGSFGMAGAIYRRKYNRWPGDDFPMVPRGSGWKAKVSEVYPDFGKKRSAV
jgi:DNA repair protein RadD